MSSTKATYTHAQHAKAPFSVEFDEMMDGAGQNLWSSTFVLKEAGQERVINWDWCIRLFSWIGDYLWCET